ncbi:MAG TPA: S8 family serine peptidase, partial [Steroidobacteraceae bacterium]|nr:S8 family serine peptidase [Steroidobacteraceae bacterium]
MKKPSIVVGMCSALALSLGLATAHAQESVFMGDAENGNLWFVELSGAPTADGNSLANVTAEQARFRQSAAAAGLNLTERRSYNSLFNGFALEVSAVDRKRIAQMQGVRAIYPVYNIAGPSPEEAAGSAIELAAAVNMTGASAAQTRGLTGSGIRVGIIDTGVDIDHPGFGGSGTNGTTAFPSARVVAGFDFVGNAYNAGGTGAALIPVPDPNPDDCNGHGTHVAGIVGANGAGITGVAPGVTFGAYRVFGCDGSTSADIMIAAMEMAYADGMHVINQSIGSARQWPQYPTAQAASRLAKRGVVMVASIGNNGPGGSSPDALYAAGAPGVGDDVIGVASYDNGQRSFTVNGTPYGYNPASSSPLPPTSGSLPMSRTGTPASVDDGCAAQPAGSLAGTAALIRRGTCAFHLKALNAMNAGAAAVVLYNNAAG